MLYSAARGHAEGLREALRELTAQRNAEPPACELHADWPASRRMQGQPAPPASTCPYCRREAAAKYGRIGEGLRIEGPTDGSRTPDPREAKFTTAALRKAEEKILERHEAAKMAAPGSWEEDEALERIDSLREDHEAWRDEALQGGGRGRVVAARIESGGVYVEYRAVPVPGWRERGLKGTRRERIVRVTP